MTEIFPDEDEIGRVTELSDEVLKDPVFQRSPVLARLFRYLIAKTAARESIKSFSIAFDGLEKKVGDQAELDTYARVAVARLRKTLAAHYASEKVADQIYIDTGTYQVRLRRPSLQSYEITGVDGEPANSKSKTLLDQTSRPYQRAWLLLALVGVLSLIGCLVVEYQYGLEIARWKNSSLPSVGIISQNEPAGSPVPAARLAAQRQELIAALEQHNGFVVLDRPSGEMDFTVRLSVGSRKGILSQTVTLTETATGIVVWASTFPIIESNGMETVTKSAVASIAPPNGAMIGYLRTKGYDINTPIGCWLRFTEGVQRFNTNGDTKLRNCAEAWYENAPDTRLAAFLHAWTLLDSAALRNNAEERMATVRQATAILHRAIVLNPHFALFRIAAMRAYALQGNRALVLESAADAVRLGQNNRLIVGMAASTLAYWNDPSGEKILTNLSHAAGAAYPWEHVGLFAAAMMRDDTNAAGREVTAIEKFEGGQPLLLIIRAAYASRIGQQEDANTALTRLRANPLMRLIGVKSLVGKLPIAPEVAHRLREWLH